MSEYSNALKNAPNGFIFKSYPREHAPEPFDNMLL